MICKMEMKEHEIIWTANLMQQGDSIDVYLAPRVSCTYAHHQDRVHDIHWVDGVCGKPGLNNPVKQ